MKSYLTTLSNANKNNNKILLLLIDLDKNNKSFSIIIPNIYKECTARGMGNWCTPFGKQHKVCNVYTYYSS